jgi:hypothetical protein
MGWSADFQSIGFLMPMTLVILAALIVLLMAMFNGKRGDYTSDPLNPRTLLSVSPDTEEDKPAEWHDKVVYRREVPDSRMIVLIVEANWRLHIGVKNSAYQLNR